MTAMRWMAALIWRLPPRSRRWRLVLPELTGIGLLPPRATLPPYPTAELAASLDRTRSPWVRSLDGPWEFKLVGQMIVRVLDGLAANRTDNSKIEHEVREEVRTLCKKFPIYGS